MPKIYQFAYYPDRLLIEIRRLTTEKEPYVLDKIIKYANGVCIMYSKSKDADGFKRALEACQIFVDCHNIVSIE